MADPHRLFELRRQRELIASHLRWLDEQIAAAAGVGSASAPSPRQETPLPPPASPLEGLVETDERPEVDLSKTGCWLIFLAAMLAFCGLAVWTIYHFWG